MNSIFDLMDMEVQDEDRETPNAGLNLRNIPIGGEFTANGIEFIRLGFEQGGILCVTKNSMFSSEFHNDRNNNFNYSLIREKIRQEFLPCMEGIELIPFTMDLMACNGETDYGVCVDDAGLLTMDLYRKYRYQIPLNGNSMWLSTPFTCTEDYPYVMFVHSTGYVDDYGAGNAVRCRPACIFAI